MRMIDADTLNYVRVRIYHDDGTIGGYNAVVPSSEIKNSPTVDAVPVRHGKWIRDEFGTRCGACGLYAYHDKFDQPWESPYCPMCGAKMDEEDEE